MENTDKPITLKALAARLGMHVSTISRVLNGSQDDASLAASPETVQRIRQLATELNYRPNPHATSLKTQRSRVIGVLVPRLSDLVLATIYEGIDEAAAKAAYPPLSPIPTIGRIRSKSAEKWRWPGGWTA